MDCNKCSLDDLTKTKMFSSCKKNIKRKFIHQTDWVLKHYFGTVIARGNNIN